MKAYDTLKQKLSNKRQSLYDKVGGKGSGWNTEISPKGLAGLAMMGIVAGTGFGCANMRTNQTDLVYNFDFKNQTQNDSRYKIERVVLHGKEFYVKKREVKNETELPFELLPFDKTSRIIDLNAIDPRKRVKLESEESYISKRVEGINGKENNYADALILNPNDNSQYKIKGIKSNVKKTDIGSLTNAEFNGSSIKKTEQNACYGIRKTTILGEKYFFPHVEEIKTNSNNKLNFYFIPVKGAKLKIRNSDGRISIENNDKIYRPVDELAIIKELAKKEAERKAKEEVERKRRKTEKEKAEERARAEKENDSPALATEIKNIN